MTWMNNCMRKLCCPFFWSTQQVLYNFCIYLPIKKIKPQNDHTTLQLISNECMLFLSLVFIKKYPKYMNKASNFSFWIFHMGHLKIIPQHWKWSQMKALDVPHWFWLKQLFSKKQMKPSEHCKQYLFWLL